MVGHSIIIRQLCIVEGLGIIRLPSIHQLEFFCHFFCETFLLYYMFPESLRGQKQVKLTICLPICCHDRLCWVHPDLLIICHYFQRKNDSILHFVCSCTLHAGHIGADGGALQGILFVKDLFVYVLSSFDKTK